MYVFVCVYSRYYIYIVYAIFSKQLAITHTHTYVRAFTLIYIRTHTDMHIQCIIIDIDAIKDSKMGMHVAYIPRISLSNCYKLFAKLND